MTDKVITHEEARIEAVSYNYEAIRVILKYITQQEKEDELLGLYRNLSMETDVFERSKYWEQINKIELEKIK